MGPQNAVVGDDSFGTDIPQTQVPEEDLAEVRNAAKFSKSKEFKKLKTLLEAKIKYYQNNLPGGQPAEQVDPTVAANMWPASVVIVREFQAIIDAYEQAAEYVDEPPK